MVNVQPIIDSAFRGRRVLVTGDTGFKGSWLCLWLHRVGAQVTGFALPPDSKESHFTSMGLQHIIRHVMGDIRDPQAVKRIFSDTQPEVVFHLAAQSLVRYSYDEPELTFGTNVSGSVNVLEAVRLSDSIRALVYVTSDKCYRNKEWIWGYRENDELGGHDPYSASKAAAEIVFSAYQDSYFLARPTLGAATVRAGNVIGGGDWALDRLVPDAIRALRAGKPFCVRNPIAVRPWQHVLEPLAGYLLTAARLLVDPKGFSGPWNFGPNIDSVCTVMDLAEMILREWGGGDLEIIAEPDERHETKLLLLNSDKARQRIPWRPRWNAQRAITETVRWYRGVQDGKSALEISSQQISDYMVELA